jgi:multidrug efflux system outer membrane protein
MRKLFLSGILGFILFVPGCRVGPKYVPPQIESPEEWKATPSENIASPKVDYWWEVFNDDILSDLEKQAIENSPNLYVALQKIFEARAMAGIEGADLYPQLNLNPSYSNQGELFKPFLPPGLLNLFPTPIGKIPNFRVHELQYLLPLNLWGKLAQRYESALFNAQAQEEAYLTSLLSLTADVATTYFQTRSLDAQKDLLQETIATRKKNLDLKIPKRL